MPSSVPPGVPSAETMLYVRSSVLLPGLVALKALTTAYGTTILIGACSLS